MRVSVPLLLIILVGVLPAHEATHTVRAKEYNAGPYNYMEYLPGCHYDSPSAPLPLMIFLHGIGECANSTPDLRVAITKHGPHKLIANGSTWFNAQGIILCSPQSPSSSDWWNQSKLDQFVARCCTCYPIDRDRIYVTGLSMGGEAIKHAARNPGLYAGVLVCCTASSYYYDLSFNGSSLSGTAVWFFHAYGDSSVTRLNSDNWANAILAGALARFLNCMTNYPHAGGNPSSPATETKTGRLDGHGGWVWESGVVAAPPGRPPSYTVYTDSSHDCWTRTYDNPAVLEWLVAQRRLDPTANPHGSEPTCIPGIIEAEYYDRGAEGHAYHDQNGTPVVAGGGDTLYLTDAAPGEWVRYALDVPTHGAYHLRLYMRTTDTVMDALVIDVNGRAVARPLSLPNTNGSWMPVDVLASLRPGVCALRIFFQKEGFDIDRIELTYAGMIVDNCLDADLITVTGSWPRDCGTGGAWGLDLLYNAWPPVHDGRSVRFTPLLARTADYDVCEWHDASSNRETAVPMSIVHNGGTSTTTVNQCIDGSTWVRLGTYNFSPGTGSVTIGTTGTSGQVIADAVSFILKPRPGSRSLVLAVNGPAGRLETLCTVAQDGAGPTSTAFTHLAPDLRSDVECSAAFATPMQSDG